MPSEMALPWKLRGEAEKTRILQPVNCYHATAGGLCGFNCFTNIIDLFYCTPFAGCAVRITTCDVCFVQVHIEGHSGVACLVPCSYIIFHRGSLCVISTRISTSTWSQHHLFPSCSRHLPTCYHQLASLRRGSYCSRFRLRISITVHILCVLIQQTTKAGILFHWTLFQSRRLLSRLVYGITQANCMSKRPFLMIMHWDGVYSKAQTTGILWT